MENEIWIDECSITLSPNNKSHEYFAIKGGITVPKNKDYKFIRWLTIEYDFMDFNNFFELDIQEFSATTKDHLPATIEVINVTCSKVLRCTKVLTGNDHECEFKVDTNLAKIVKNQITSKTETNVVTKDKTRQMPQTSTKKDIEIIGFFLW
ncbi:hypothetical protein RF11_08399 [Thelohanellus kitauei]|uniref:Uncharacterized protein n=1 Tax=Thelohanellus kitauei TaxID=669202 RepID=A0A0C2J4K9_THEKT|nr:hypothetical protein RF11_08399 [Thelohanellus kitauei]